MTTDVNKENDRKDESRKKVGFYGLIQLTDLFDDIIETKAFFAGDIKIHGAKSEAHQQAMILYLAIPEESRAQIIQDFWKAFESIKAEWEACKQKLMNSSNIVQRRLGKTVQEQVGPVLSKSSNIEN